MEKRKKALKQAQLNINKEIELLVEIEDIKDELDIIKMVLDDQYSVLSEGNHDKQHKSPGTPVSHVSLPDVDGKAVDYHVNVNRKTVEHMISRTKNIHAAVSFRSSG